MTARVLSRTVAERFWSKVDKTDTCWLWAGYLKPNGYASFYPGGGRHVQKVYAHRWAYEATRGTIPEGHELDHLCRVRHCVNPTHLEPVTHRVNMLRGETIAAMNASKTHCPRGHVIDGVLPNGHRFCSTCKPGRGKGHHLKTHCKHGHPFDEQNTYWHGGYRYCRTCRAIRNVGR